MWPCRHCWPRARAGRDPHASSYLATFAPAAGLDSLQRGSAGGWHHADPYWLSHTAQKVLRPSACSS